MNRKSLLRSVARNPRVLRGFGRGPGVAGSRILFETHRFCRKPVVSCQARRFYKHRSPFLREPINFVKTRRFYRPRNRLPFLKTIIFAEKSSIYMKTYRFYRLPLRKPIDFTDPLFGQIHHGGSITPSSANSVTGRRGGEGGGTKAGKIYHGVGQIHHGGGHGARGSHTPRGVGGRQLVCPRLATWPSRLTAGQGGRSLSGNLAKKFNPSTPRTILGRCSANVCHLRPLQTTPA